MLADQSWTLDLAQGLGGWRVHWSCPQSQKLLALGPDLLSWEMGKGAGQGPGRAPQEVPATSHGGGGGGTGRKTSSLLRTLRPREQQK